MMNATRTGCGRSCAGTMMVIACAALAAATAHAGEECTPAPDGDFNDGLDGWSVVPLVSEEGQAATTLSAEVIDGSTYQSTTGHQFDSAVLRLTASAHAGGTAAGAASSEVRVTRTFTATERFLRVERGGGFEFFYFGEAGRELVAGIQVADSRTLTNVATTLLHDEAVGPGTECDFGLSILGTLDADPSVAFVDLADAGIEVGSDVEVTFFVRTGSQATVPCQLSDTAATLIIDGVSFCADGPMPSDLDEDGEVGVGDLLMLLEAWGPCFKGGCGKNCFGDIDGDCTVGIGDLLEMLSDWS